MKKIEVSLAALDTLTRMVEELQAERDAFEKDAFRYRFLRNPGFAPVAIVDKDFQLIEGDEADAAIDRAING